MSEQSDPGCRMEGMQDAGDADFPTEARVDPGDLRRVTDYTSAIVTTLSGVAGVGILLGKFSDSRIVALDAKSARAFAAEIIAHAEEADGRNGVTDREDSRLVHEWGAGVAKFFGQGKEAARPGVSIILGEHPDVRFCVMSHEKARAFGRIILRPADEAAAAIPDCPAGKN